MASILLAAIMVVGVHQRIDPTENVEHLLAQQRPKALGLEILRGLDAGAEHEPRPNISAVVVAVGFQGLGMHFVGFRPNNGGGAGDDVRQARD